MLIYSYTWLYTAFHVLVFALKLYTLTLDSTGDIQTKVLSDVIDVFIPTL